MKTQKMTNKYIYNADMHKDGWRIGRLCSWTENQGTVLKYTTKKKNGEPSAPAYKMNTALNEKREFLLGCCRETIRGVTVSEDSVLLSTGFV